jgi:hypothetical protein
LVAQLHRVDQGGCHDRDDEEAEVFSISHMILGAGFE